MDGVMSGIYKEFPGPGAEYKTDLPIPEVGSRDILVKVKATAICGTDLHILPWTQYAQERIKLPLIFGHEFAGDVVEIGSEVNEVKIGDRVAGETHIPCNNCIQCKTKNRHICENMKIIGVHVRGSFAQYIRFPVDCAFKIDDDIDYVAGSMLEPMGVAVHGVDVASVAGKTVVIYGCGPIGLMAVGAAKACKKKAVIAIDIFPDKLAVAKKMGADIIINSKEISPLSVVKEKYSAGVDVVIDYTGNSNAIRSGFELLRKGGTFVMVGLPSGDVTLPITEAIIYKEITVIGVTGRLMYQTWDHCLNILQSGDFSLEPIIGGIYSLKDFQKAFDGITGGKPGKMILLPWPDEN